MSLPVTSSSQLNTMLNPKVTHSLCLSRVYVSEIISLVKSVSLSQWLCWWDLSELQSVFGLIFIAVLYILQRTHQFVYLFYYWVFGVFLLWGCLYKFCTCPLIHVHMYSFQYIPLSGICQSRIYIYSASAEAVNWFARVVVTSTSCSMRVCWLLHILSSIWYCLFYFSHSSRWSLLWS